MIASGVVFGQLFMFFICGMISCVIHNVFGVFKKLTKNNLIAVIVSDIASCIICGILFVLFLFAYKSGGFQVYEVIFFISGIIFMQIFIRNLFARPLSWVYNKVTSRKKKINKV